MPKGVQVILFAFTLFLIAMFADIELIGIPHRVVVSERGVQAGTFEYRHRRADAAEALDHSALMSRLGASPA